MALKLRYISNKQNQDRSIDIPEVLKPYLGMEPYR